jgi:septum formation protein
MLRLLAGREHRVITGLALVDAATGASRHAALTTAVHFRPLSDDEIAAYVATGEPRDKAGGYAIQGRGAGLIDRYEGCYTNVVGLPLCAVATLLDTAGVSPPQGWAGCRRHDGERCAGSIEQSLARLSRHEGPV